MNLDCFKVLYKLTLLMIEPYKYTGIFKTDLLLIGSVNQELFTKQRATDDLSSRCFQRLLIWFRISIFMLVRLINILSKLLISISDRKQLNWYTLESINGSICCDKSSNQHFISSRCNYNTQKINLHRYATVQYYYNVDTVLK